VTDFRRTFGHLAREVGARVRELIYGKDTSTDRDPTYWDHVHLADEGGTYRGPSIVIHGTVHGSKDIDAQIQRVLDDTQKPDEDES
jgi:hypothetical protein